MIFWITTAFMAILVALTLVLALLRSRGQAGPVGEFDLRVYRDQLKEVDRDLARGVIGASDAGRARTEISRRILAADVQNHDAGAAVAQPKVVGFVTAGVVGVFLIGGAFGLYLHLGAPGYGDLSLKTRIAAAQTARETRPSQATAEASLPANAQLEQFSPEYMKLIQQLRDTVASRPDDIQGHALLARNEAAMGNFKAAYEAQRMVLRLKGDTVQASDLTDYADMLILAAGGYISPEAEGALASALQIDPQNGVARYYYGLMLAQTGRQDRTFRIWNKLLTESSPDAPWVAPIRFQIEDIAMRAGVNYTLPPAPAPAAPVRGPDADDIQAAQEMSPQDRQEMIRNMVEGLSDRLAAEGGPPEEWARLIGALGVMGNEERAIAIYTEALEIFAGNSAAIETIRNGARQAALIP